MKYCIWIPCHFTCCDCKGNNEASPHLLEWGPEPCRSTNMRCKIMSAQVLTHPWPTHRHTHRVSIANDWKLWHASNPTRPKTCPAKAMASHNILSLRSYFANLGFRCCSFRPQHIFIPYRTISCCVYLEIALCSCKQFRWLNKRWLWPTLTRRSPKRNTKTNQSVLTHTQLCPVCSCSKSLKLCRHSF